MISAPKKIKPGKRLEGGVVRKGPISARRDQRLPERVWDRPALGAEQYWEIIHQLHHSFLVLS